MAAIEDYASGRILRSIRLAHIAFAASGLPVVGPVIRQGLEARMGPLAIRPITLSEAGSILAGCSSCAAGPRVCQPLFPDSPGSESVFLDALGERMIQAGKARPVTREEALSVLARYPGNPLLLAKVSGRYREICRSEPAVCLYWKMRRGEREDTRPRRDPPPPGEKR